MKYCFILMLALPTVLSVSGLKGKSKINSKVLKSACKRPVHCPSEDLFCVKLKNKDDVTRDAITILLNKCDLEYAKCRGFHVSNLPIKICDHHEESMRMGNTRKKRDLSKVAKSRKTKRHMSSQSEDPEFTSSESIRADRIRSDTDQDVQNLEAATAEQSCDDSDLARDGSENEEQTEDHEDHMESDVNQMISDAESQEYAFRQADGDKESNDSKQSFALLTADDTKDVSNIDEDVGTKEVPNTDKDVDTKDVSNVDEDCSTKEVSNIREDTKEEPNTHENVDTEEVPNVDENVDTKETHNTDENVDTKETPNTDENVDTKETPNADENEDTKETPNADENVDTNETPNTDKNFDTKEAPNTDENNDTKETPTADENEDTKAKPNDDNVDNNDVNNNGVSNHEDEPTVTERLKDYDLDAVNETVDMEEYNKECPTQCPARDVMVCARCKDHVYRTFMSICHLKMFNCKHPQEKLELVSRLPCVLSAPHLAGAPAPKGRLSEPGDEDVVLKFIRCRENGKLINDDPRCKFLSVNDNIKNDDSKKER